MNPAEPPRGLQTLIHFMEEGAGQGWMRRVLAFIVIGAAVALYQFNEARNFQAPDAMDAAQLGRNWAEGRGYTTGLIRPLSLYLLQTQAAAQGRDEREILTQPHPDLENPPVYPALLAAGFKVMPVAWRTRLPADQFRQRPFAEAAISAMNIGLLGLAVGLVGWLGRRLFDSTVGGLAALLTVGTEPFWILANSGLPSMLLIVLGLGLMHFMVSFEREAAEASPSGGRLARTAVGSGAMIGLMFLTKYSFGWLALPVAAYFVWRGGVYRIRLAFLALLVVAGLAAPWVVRNWRLSGTPLGTAGFALFSGTESFPGDRLERSQHPQVDVTTSTEIIRKLILNVREIVREELPRLGGNWITLFFLVGLIVPFQNAGLNRLRLFWVVVLGLFVLVQAGGRTWLSTQFGPYTGENLLIILAPVVFIFGAGFLVTLLDHVEWPAPVVRRLVLGTLVLVFSLPFLLAILPPREITLRDPPYRPALIREIAEYSPAGTLFMSDLPWAVAWYGPRDCLWATLRINDDPQANVANRREDFFVFVESRRPVQAVYISPYWANQSLRDRFLGDPDFAWGRFYLEVLTRQTLPDGFPLRHVLGPGYMERGHFLLAARNWWQRSNR